MQLKAAVSLLLICLWILPTHSDPTNYQSTAADTLSIGEFSKEFPGDWKPKIFSGKTNYRIVVDKTFQPPRKVLEASSAHAASGLILEKRIDLEKTPVIHWSWKTKNLYTDLNERSKEGDDFVARLYVVVDGGLFFWNTRALSYVWSSSSNVGEAWPNPYTSNAIMFAVESGDSNLGKWQYYSRNIRQDLLELTGKDIRYIDAIAIMTDSDNSGQQATTHYGDIYFSSKQNP